MSMEGPNEHPQYTGNKEFKVDPHTGVVLTPEEAEEMQQKNLENNQ